MGFDLPTCLFNHDDHDDDDDTTTTTMVFRDWGRFCWGRAELEMSRVVVFQIMLLWLWYGFLGVKESFFVFLVSFDIAWRGQDIQDGQASVCLVQRQHVIYSGSFSFLFLDIWLEIIVFFCLTHDAGFFSSRI